MATRARQIFVALFAATLVAVFVSSGNTQSAPNAHLPGWRKDSCRDRSSRG